MAEPIRWYPSAESGGQVVGYFTYDESKYDIVESLERDEKIYRKVIVLIAKPVASQDTSTTPVKPYNEKQLRARFPQAWEAFQGREPIVEGTPIKELTFLNEDTVLFLKLNGISVVEQLAMLSDARCQSLGFGWRTNRTRAQAFLKDQAEKLVRQDRVERKKAEEAA